MSLKLYNTFTKEKSQLNTLDDNKVKMYVCGPTVYDLLHIGNFRGPIFFNLVRNWLEKIGYEVTYAYNFTDVDDKIIKRANDEGVESSVISEKYISEFKKDFQQLGLRAHDHNPKVTEYMPQIIKFVEDLVANETAYVVDGEVFYEINKFEAYGKLSGKKLEDLDHHRVDIDPKKRNPHDFVLWKPSKAGEPSWDSPWGKGRPGWHIECSAMIQEIFGKSIDIHGGGIDLIFPHHENEIAQGEGRTGCTYCNYWMHNNFINMNDEKMSKSLGNVVKARDFMNNYHPEILKYLFLSVHYRSMLSVSDEKISQVMVALKRIYLAIDEATKVSSAINDSGNPDSGFVKILKTADEKIARALNDDFNSADFIGNVFEVVRSFNALNLFKKKITSDKKATADKFLNWIKEYGEVSALFNEVPSQFLMQLDEILLRDRKIDRSKVEELIFKRREARDAKDWAKSDEIRDELNLMGIELFDGQGSDREWSVKI